jgi:hypothetical protein
MKVIEKGTDRRAEVHNYVEGTVAALAEYGEYIDPRDKAICCYVPRRRRSQAQVWRQVLRYCGY